MKISELYDNYWIPPNLQRHMCRVAAVGLTLVDTWSGSMLPNRDYVARTLLLHDMGKIIHYDFTNSAYLLGDDGEIEHWKQVQRDFIVKFGSNEHHAMLTIAKEIGVSNDVLGLLDEFGSTNVEYKVKSSKWCLKICTYSDFRVGPFGILSVKERFDELIARSRKTGFSQLQIKEQELDAQACLELEKQIQGCISINPEQISDESIKVYFVELRDYQF